MIRSHELPGHLTLRMRPRRIRRSVLNTVLLIISLIANFSAFADEPGLVVLDVTLIGNRHRDHILLRNSPLPRRYAPDRRTGEDR